MAEVSSGEISDGEVASLSFQKNENDDDDDDRKIDHNDDSEKKRDLYSSSSNGDESASTGSKRPRLEEEDDGSSKLENQMQFKQQHSHGPAAALSSRPAAATSSARPPAPTGPSGHQVSVTAAVHPHWEPSPYGFPIYVKETRGNFPNVGSVFGPYFCLGKLGQGTFSSVHKCINLEYHNSTQANLKSRCRLAAAKVELQEMKTGVLETEASILDFLHSSCPPETVPVYLGFYRCGQNTAMVMEYLPGEDMNMVRENVMKQTRGCRRLNVEDAVYLTVDVFLPLLRNMHSVGFVHRDVKPSNVVRRASDSSRYNQQKKKEESGEGAGVNGHDEAAAAKKTQRGKFCLVDFGLSKSIVIPEDSSWADPKHTWPKDRPWMKPANFKGNGCYRKPREKAEFRGSSMYASLRVHQSKDYCPRDDVWSALYVFCDLLSGGLPWMTHAAIKDKAEVTRLKEIVQGNGETDEMHQLLMGDEYHTAKARQDIKIKEAKMKNEPPPPMQPLPIPLPMSTDQKLVGHLRKAFRHLGSLEFWDMPDYDLIAECVRGFLDDPSKCPNVPKVQWEEVVCPSTFSPTPSSVEDKETMSSSTLKTERRLPLWKPESEPYDPACLVNTDLFAGVQEQAAHELQMQVDDFATEEDPKSRLPVNLQFALEQMTNHTRNIDVVPKHIALRDWFQVTLPLIYQDFWDVKKYEEEHRKSGDDGYRRPLYLKLLRQCQEWAQKFDYFSDPACFFHEDEEPRDELKAALGFPRRRRRTISTDNNISDMILVSKCLMTLKIKIQEEQNRPSAPPMRISFGPS